MKNITLVFFLCLLALGGCATGITNHIPKEYNSEYSSVTIMRSENIVGAASSAKVVLDKKIIAYIGSGQYFSFPLKPGSHSLAVQGGAYLTPDLLYEFKSKESYFFLISPSWGSMVEIEIVSKEYAEGKMKKYRQLSEKYQE